MPIPRLFRTLACVGLGSLLLGSFGCASKNDRGLAVRTVTTSDFVRTAPADAPAERAPTVADVTPAMPTDESSEVATLTTDSDQANAPAAAPSAPSTPSATPAPANQSSFASRGEQLMQPGDMVVVDSVVGQVSGRPLFADEILAGLADQLRAESARLNARDFQIRAQQIIRDNMMQLVLTELFLAEAEAALTPQQQMGLLAFVRQMQERTIATGQGSRLITEQRLQDELGMSLEQYTEKERNTILIRFLIDKRIQPRVIVSWKDIEREYRAREAEFKPPASVTLKRIRLNANQQELIEQAKARFNNHESFEAVAESLQLQVTTLDPLQMGPGGMADLEISEAYKPYLAKLDVGETTAPIELTGRVEWLHVDAIQQPPGKTIYDVQQQLQRELELRREAEERGKYIQALFERGIHDELDAMVNRVLVVALLRYGK